MMPGLALAQEQSAPSGIVGGQESEPGEWPAVVGIVIQGGGLCTGTLISDRLVLTAAHCIAGRENPADYGVVVGDSISSGGVSLEVDQVGAHPDFCGKPEEDCSDFGYVRLAVAIEGVEALAVLETQEDYDALIEVGDRVTLVGFGSDDEGRSGTKREVVVSVTKRSTQGVAFAAGGEGKDSCNGDSGGPALVRKEDGSLALAGVLSYGSSECGQGGMYGVAQNGLCWISEDSGIEIRPESCSDCACIDLGEELSEGCSCTVQNDTPRGFVWLTLCFFMLMWRGRLGSRRANP